MTDDFEQKLTLLEGLTAEASAQVEKLKAQNRDPEAARLLTIPVERWTRAERRYVQRWTSLGRQVIQEADEAFARAMHLRAEIVTDPAALEGQTRLAAIAETLDRLTGLRRGQLPDSH